MEYMRALVLRLEQDEHAARLRQRERHRLRHLPASLYWLAFAALALLAAEPLRGASHAKPVGGVAVG